MAEYLFPTTGQRSEYTPETTAKLRALEQRQKMVNALIEQGMQPKQVRQAGRFVVAPSMMEQLSGPLTVALGALGSGYLEKERGEIQKEETAKVAKALQDYTAAQAPIPAWTGRRVPGTGTPAVPGSPAVDEIPESYTTQVADAIIGPPPPNVPRGHRPIESPAPEIVYTPGVPGRAAVPAQAAVPDRRETVEEALRRESFPPETIRAVMEGWRPSDASGDLKRVIEEAERPDQVGRARTPEELHAADMALLASGVPNAWNLVDLTMRQREADKARAETIEARKFSQIQEKELKLQAIQERKEASIRDNETKQENAKLLSQYHMAQIAQAEQNGRDSTEIKKMLAITQENARRDRARHDRETEKNEREKLETQMEIARLKGEEFKANETKSLGYAVRAAEAHEILNATAADENLMELGAYQTFSKMPFGAGDAVTWAINHGMSEATQKAMQARRNFINAVLRVESMATITEAEFENGNKQYFPVSGDSPAVIAQKAANREDSIKSLIYQSGKAWKLAPKHIAHYGDEGLQKPAGGKQGGFDKAMEKYRDK